MSKKLLAFGGELAKPANKAGSGRGGLSRFRPGQSGNPNGRPKVAEEFRAACRERTPEVLAAWSDEVATRGENWMKAAELLMAYAHGRPTQHVDATHSLAEMTDEQLEARYRSVIAAASATRPPESGE